MNQLLGHQIKISERKRIPLPTAFPATTWIQTIVIPHRHHLRSLPTGFPHLLSPPFSLPLAPQ